MYRERRVHFGIAISEIAVVLIGLVASHASAQNWPSFRGNNGDGIGNGDPPITWNVQSGENVLWKVPIPGLGLSSPVIWGDRIFLTTAVQDSGEASLDTGWLGGTGDSPDESGEWEWRVICLDKKTGQTVWSRTVHKGTPRFKRHLKSSHANCTPATDGKYVAAFFGSEGLHVFDMDGKLIWKKDLGPLNAGPANYPGMQWGFASSPIIHEGRVIVQCDAQQESYWAAFDVTTGTEQLRVIRGDDSTWTTPTIHQGKDRTLLICNGYKMMAGYELWSGQRRWHLNGGGDIPVPRPLVDGENVVLTNGHGKKPIYVVNANATGDVTPTDSSQPDGIKWWSNSKGSYMPTPIIVDDLLYVADDSGIFTSFDMKDGDRVIRKRLPGSGQSTYSASPVSAAGRIYVTSEAGQIDVIAADREYKVLASNEMGEVCMATPAISDGLLFVRGQHHLFCLGKR